MAQTIKREKVDLENVAGEDGQIAEDIERLDEAEEELLDAVEDEYDQVVDVPPSVAETLNGFDEARSRLEKRRERIQEVVDEWGGGEVVLKELTGGDVAKVSDKLASGRRSPANNPGVRMQAMLDQALVDQPEGAPENPAEWPAVITDYLQQKVSEMNSFGGGTNSPSDGWDRLSERFENS